MIWSNFGPAQRSTDHSMDQHHTTSLMQGMIWSGYGLAWRSPDHSTDHHYASNITIIIIIIIIFRSTHEHNVHHSCHQNHAHSDGAWSLRLQGKLQQWQSVKANPYITNAHIYILYIYRPSYTPSHPSIKLWYIKHKWPSTRYHILVIGKPEFWAYPKFLGWVRYWGWTTSQWTIKGKGVNNPIQENIKNQNEPSTTPIRCSFSRYIVMALCCIALHCLALLCIAFKKHQFASLSNYIALHCFA